MPRLRAVPSHSRGSGLPGGLILNPSDGNLSGTPSVAGSFPSLMRALLFGRAKAEQDYHFTVLPALPAISIGTPQVIDSGSISVPYEVLDRRG